MCSHDPSSVLAHVQDARPAHERDVVEVDDVCIDSVNHLPQRLGFEVGAPGQLGRQRREHAEAALQPVHVQSGWRRVWSQRVPSADGVERVSAMEDVNLVAPPQQGPRKAINICGVAPEAVGAKKRGDQAELQGRPPCRGAKRSLRSTIYRPTSTACQQNVKRRMEGTSRECVLLVSVDISNGANSTLRNEIGER
jgi:hypothetical protein